MIDVPRRARLGRGARREHPKDLEEHRVGGGRHEAGRRRGRACRSAAEVEPVCDPVSSIERASVCPRDAAVIRELLEHILFE